MNRLEIIQSIYGEDIEWSASALSNLMFVIEKAQKVVEDRIEKALLDPENQPTQWGTVTLTMHEALENSLMQSGLQIESWQGRYYAKEGELEKRQGDIRLGKLVWKYIDRMNDLTEHDTAADALKDFLVEANAITDEILDGKEQSDE